MKRIYMDYQATTPVDKEVLEAMMPYFTDKFGNPHSSSHQFGWESEDGIKWARNEIGSLINADDPSEIIFTSGATESNNLALFGVAEYMQKFSQTPEKNHIITMVTEHPCIMAVCQELINRGFDVTFLKPQKNGIVSLDDLKNAITDRTFLVSIMAVHNEIGIIQPLEEIGKITREKGIYFHTDAAQAFGKIPIDVNKMNIDMMSISGHKIYAPKGIGALYVRKKPRVRLRPLIHGGGQERGMRSGTLPTPLIVGLGKAAEIAKRDMAKNYEYVKGLSDYFLDRIFKEIPYIFLNGDKSQRFPGCLNISFPAIEGESLLMSLKGVALSTGSACSSAKLESSPVIKALGVDELMSHSNLRFGIGKYTTKEEIDLVIDNLVKSVQKLRDMSPVWEDIEEKLNLQK